MWITVQSWRDLCPHQTGLFVEADSGKRDKRAALPDCVLDSYSYWHLFLFCECVEPHSHTHIHLSFSTLTHRATFLNMGKERDVTIWPSPPGMSVQYWSILGSIGSRYLSSVTYLNCYGYDCCRSHGWLRVSRWSSCIELEKQRCLSSPNKDISPLNKSMLTVCLPRLGDSPTLWFLIRHIMRRGEIGIGAEDCCMG